MNTSQYADFVQATDFPPFTLRLPQGQAIPLVCDSPHSGKKYPQDFRFSGNFHHLRGAEDTYVNELWSAIPDVGGSLLAAEFPRSYIDPNRDTTDIDISMLSDQWPHPITPTEKTRLGIGLIWKKCRNEPMYDRLLSSAEIQSRIDRFFTPYHQALSQQIESTYEKFGAVWHLNLHCMPENSYELLGIKTDKKLADFVLGDKDGKTCDPEFIQMVAEAIRQQGYTVAFNDPFKGVALIERLGRPHENRHSIQIEIRDTIYMSESTYEKNGHYADFQKSLTQIAHDIASYIKGKQ